MPSECGRDLGLGLHVAAAAHAPGRAGEIAESVHRNRHGLIERRREKRRPRMRQVVLHLVHRRAQTLAWERSAPEPRLGVPYPAT